MKYSLSEVKEKVQLIRSEYSSVEDFFKSQSGWIGRNFDSYKYIDKPLLYVEDWLKIIELNDTFMLDGWGTSEQEQMDSYFGTMLSSRITPSISDGVNLEENKIFIDLLLEIGVPGMLSYFADDYFDENLDFRCINIFINCVESKQMEIFDRLITNTRIIYSDQYVEILKQSSNVEFVGDISNLPALFSKSIDQHKADYLNALDNNLISLLEKVCDKDKLISLIKEENEELIFSERLQKALQRVELDVTLPKNGKSTKINKL